MPKPGKVLHDDQLDRLWFKTLYEKATLNGQTSILFEIWNLLCILSRSYFELVESNDHHAFTQVALVRHRVLPLLDCVTHESNAQERVRDTIQKEEITAELLQTILQRKDLKHAVDHLNQVRWKCGADEKDDGKKGGGEGNRIQHPDRIRVSPKDRMASVIDCLMFIRNTSRHVARKIWQRIRMVYDGTVRRRNFPNSQLNVTCCFPTELVSFLCGPRVRIYLLPAQTECLLLQHEQQQQPPKLNVPKRRKLPAFLFESKQQQPRKKKARCTERLPSIAVTPDELLLSYDSPFTLDPDMPPLERGSILE